MSKGILQHCMCDRLRVLQVCACDRKREQWICHSYAYITTRLSGNRPAQTACPHPCQKAESLPVSFLAFLPSPITSSFLNLRDDNIDLSMPYFDDMYDMYDDFDDNMPDVEDFGYDSDMCTSAGVPYSASLARAYSFINRLEGFGRSQPRRTEARQGKGKKKLSSLSQSKRTALPRNGNGNNNLPIVPAIDPSKPPRGPGMRGLDIRLLSSCQNDRLPFSISEVPCFSRGSWLNLNSHRYKVESPLDLQGTSDAAESLVADLKRQLLMRFKKSDWPEGEEPEITFFTVEAAGHSFVNILYKTAQQHAIGRKPTPPLKAGNKALRPWQHAAWVDEREYRIIQFSHPSTSTEVKDRKRERKRERTNATRDDDGTGWYRLSKIEDDLKTFWSAVDSALSNTCLGAFGKPLRVCVLPDGFPQKPQPASTSQVARPEYIVVYRNSPAVETFPLIVEVPEWDKKDWVEAGTKTYIKLWRNNMCTSCKNVDGHLAKDCGQKQK